ncbi:hypothetical protein DSM112329_03437 [Paraconexibacter sp. AEG42_29]|uniref:AMP-dependent synthetase/ligase domain-containing protein n=1 Tax=Paraconexibacter sp. AEG42_29 TaxID=2997339 RepID=A0AAU7AXX7_9ACTN
MTDDIPDTPPAGDPGPKPGSLEWLADQDPEQGATVEASSGACTSRAEHDALASGLARGLSATHGVTAGDRVAIALPPGPDLLRTQYALAKLGAAPLLLSPHAASSAGRRLAAIAGAAILIADGPATTDRSTDGDSDGGRLRVVPRSALAVFAERHADGPRLLSGAHPPVDGVQVAAAGDTGGPGRVLVRVRTPDRIALLARPFADLLRRVALAPGATHLLGRRGHAPEPQFWASVALVTGGVVVTEPAADAATLLAALAEHQVGSTVMDLATLRAITTLPDAVTEGADLTALQRIILDGPAPDAALVTACADLFGDDVLHRVAATPQTGPYAHAGAEDLAADPAALTPLDGVTLTRSPAGDVHVTSPLAADGALGGPAERGDWPAPPAWTGEPVPADG